MEKINNNSKKNNENEENSYQNLFVKRMNAKNDLIEICKCFPDILPFCPPQTVEGALDCIFYMADRNIKKGHLSVGFTQLASKKSDPFCMTPRILSYLEKQSYYE